MFVCVTLDGAFAQENDRVKGRLSFKPPFSGIAEVYLNLFLPDSAAPLDAIVPSATTPYRFDDHVPDYSPSESSVVIRVEVVEPVGYAPLVPEYRKPATRPFRQDIRLRRVRDVYITLRSKLPEKEPRTVIRDLEYMTELADTAALKIEAYRGLAAQVEKTPGASAKWSTSLEVLEAAHDAGATKGLGKDKLRAYWQERFDALLREANYAKRRQPAVELARDVSAEGGELSTAWEDLINDYKADYKVATLGADPLADLQAIQKGLNHPVALPAR